MSRVQVFAFDLTGAPISDVEIELISVDGVGEAMKTTKESRGLYGDCECHHEFTYEKSFGLSVFQRLFTVRKPSLGAASIVIC